MDLRISFHVKICSADILQATEGKEMLVQNFDIPLSDQQ